jgi:outer membrane protein TolC
MTTGELKRSVTETVQRELAEAQTHVDPRVTERESKVEDLGIDPRFMPELQTLYGKGQALMDFDPGPDLFGQQTRRVRIGLERVVKSTVANNSELEFARLAPAIAQARIVQAEAVFDWTLFSSFDYTKTDQPQTAPTIGATPVGLGATVSDRTSGSIGLRRTLVSGGEFTIEHDMIYTDVMTPGLSTAPNPARELNFLLRVDQPLLRGFGSDITQAQIRLERNAERDSIAELERQLSNKVTEVEQNYWQLVLAHRRLQIAERNLERGVEVRDTLQKRLEARLRVTQAEVAEAEARVAQRRTALIQAQRDFRLASDRIKAEMNDPELPIGSSVLLVPDDAPLDEPIEFSLADLLLTAFDRRPELRQAVLSIDDTSIRLLASKNNLLPRLDLRAQVSWAALADDYGDAYDQLYEGQFVDYLLGLQFEYALGNRSAEAQVRQRTLERMQAVEAYKNAVQDVTLDVVTSLVDVLIDYQLIGEARKSKVAAAESLRTLNVQLDKTRQLDVNNLNLALQRQDQLAEAERTEASALASYNNSIAGLYRSIGTALDRNRIDFVVPDVLSDGRRVRGKAERVYERNQRLDR